MSICPKPFDLKELTGIVQRALEEPKKRPVADLEEAARACRWSAVRRQCRRSTAFWLG
jgi:DNA-binding NtrC family response regulator